MCENAFDLRLVPLPQLNNRSSCEGGKHGEVVPALGEFAPDMLGDGH
jgi:hypothetical protein